MKRIDRIYAYLVEQSQGKTLDEWIRIEGFTASDIAKDLGILRNNVSAELNKLLRQKRIIKIKGRPVHYLVKQIMEDLLGTKLPEDQYEYENILEVTGGQSPDPGNGPSANHDTAWETNPFDDLIGSKTSLKVQVEQAKAAVLYPPHGLHTLIVGQTGVGKTLFANLMFNYAKLAAPFMDEDAQFIVFNCADYANNPQLLISHIFGHIKGAFTGADSEKDGLVSKADGGMLFLDEIHRLPPEGQEMLFYFMDTGTYAKLGETERNRNANVLIVGATTEDPESSLLKTFVRRIPILIRIPSFEERPAIDKIEILKFLLAIEANRVQKPIKIDAESMKALIGNTSYGNVGQLKSNIQLVCANGFLHCLHDDVITIHFKDLPSELKNGFFYFSRKRQEIQELSDLIDSYLTVYPEGENKALFEEDPYEPDFNLYNIIEDKVSFMMEQDVSDEDINRFLKLDIDIHLNKFYNKFSSYALNREKILKIVSEDILNFSEEVQDIVEKRLKCKVNERFLLAFSLHLTSFLKRVKNQQVANYTNIENVINDRPQEYQLSLDICKMIGEKYRVHVPVKEAMYLTILLTSLIDEQKAEQVAILVAAHGFSTASSMVSVVKSLLGESNVDCIDMPLDMDPKYVLEEMKRRVKEIDMGKGVLLLVDMGSLTGFGDVITQETGIKTRTIDMVTTALVIEAIRKATIMEMDLDDIYESLKEFRGYGSYQMESKPRETGKPVKPQAILSVCSTGEGTAEKLKQLITRLLKNIGKTNIAVIPLPINEVEEKKEMLMQKYDILLAVGIADPKVQAPFVPLESLFMGDGETQVTHLIQNHQLLKQPPRSPAMVREMTEESLNEFLTFLNPKKVITAITAFVTALEKIAERPFNNASKINMNIHIGCALERMVTQSGLIYKNDITPEKTAKIKKYKKAAQIFEDQLKLKLSDDELYYIADMIDHLSAEQTAAVR
ncbi:sigma 54-interacting transcriptional regulator [Weizmannia coagulans]|uniref:PTS system transcriptional activator n=4 Tax=Heyndrickxia TaxID=2837504 RepID=A0A0C5CRW1_HEYCO|nr:MULTISPECIES: sigma-54-dependent transcriptional regulator [Heyndrickxia]AEO99865.1 PTS system transcriptional activator [Heyndrickxia coagulans 36D1]AJO24162.1 PTS system transcriptional activator [Heyndrickxia coagulans]AKN54359.1 NtrC family Transcriptional regulator [Heyndrickxia coagulans]ATW84075.1 sigma-54-dependent transcriptional regulator [Heyndrickxia coagulans]AVD55272.1 sigma-54-dependent transcriptional regulator [Heyndrickxia coagulans]